jgi:hypothetical protein
MPMPCHAMPCNTNATLSPPKIQTLKTQAQIQKCKKPPSPIPFPMRKKKDQKTCVHSWGQQDQVCPEGFPLVQKLQEELPNPIPDKVPDSERKKEKTQSELLKPKKPTPNQPLPSPTAAVEEEPPPPNCLKTSAFRAI